MNSERPPLSASRRRADFVRAHGCLPHEIEPGRSVPSDWNKALFEPWSARKKRRADTASSSKQQASQEHR